MLKLTERQLKILNFIYRNGRASNKGIVDFLNKVSRITILRDIKILLQNNLIERFGQGRSVYYKEKARDSFSRYIDVDAYFEVEPDQRKLAFEKFNFNIYSNLDVFSKTELTELKKINSDYQKKVNDLSEAEFKKEFERLTIELSWKSSQIEGNTYSLIDTEILIKEHKEAAGHNKEEAIMILNHKHALDYILDKASDFKKLTSLKIRNLHKIVVGDLNIDTGLRARPVGIVGTRYQPLDNQHQIMEAMEKAIDLINKLNDPFSKAIITILLISYIQPFVDGNKRTARLLANAVLMANKVCPLSYRSINEADYKKAMLLFYEQNNFRFFKELFIEQFKFAVNNYFQ